jgi:Zn-dependent peptidase ImmA (M78 family)
MARVAINTDIIRWGIERSGLTTQMLGQKYPNLDQWISGDKSPTFNQLSELAKKINLPIGYFFLSNPPDESLPIHFYRTDSSIAPEKPSANLLDTLYAMQRRQQWLREYLIENQNEELPFVGTASLSDEVGEVVASIRRHLNLKENWANDYSTWTDALRALYSHVDAAGINVMANGVVANNTHRKLNPREFRGFVLVDEYAPIVFVNNSDGKAAQMFTLAHELAHIWFGESGIFDLAGLQPASEQIEIHCNEVAAEFLVPTQALFGCWERFIQDPDRYQKLARQFKVSEIVIARRLLDLRLISRTEFFSFYQQYLDEIEQRADSSGGDYYNNQAFRVGPNFMRRVIEAINQGSLQFIDAFRLTNMFGKTFDKYADKVMGSL